MWGDAVEGAVLMEHTGAPGRIRISATTAEKLPAEFRTETQQAAGEEPSCWLVGIVDPATEFPNVAHSFSVSA